MTSGGSSARSEKRDDDPRKKRVEKKNEIIPKPSRGAPFRYLSDEELRGERHAGLFRLLRRDPFHHEFRAREHVHRRRRFLRERRIEDARLGQSSGVSTRNERREENRPPSPSPASVHSVPQPRFVF